MFFFFNDPAATEIYTLSLHDALPIFVEEISTRALDVEKRSRFVERSVEQLVLRHAHAEIAVGVVEDGRSEEHTSELQSRRDLVCRLLLEKKKNANLFGGY